MALVDTCAPILSVHCIFCSRGFHQIPAQLLIYLVETSLRTALKLQSCGNEEPPAHKLVSSLITQIFWDHQANISILLRYDFEPSEIIETSFSCSTVVYHPRSKDCSGFQVDANRPMKTKQSRSQAWSFAALLCVAAMNAGNFQINC